MRHELPSSNADPLSTYGNPNLTAKMNKKLDKNQFNGQFWKCLDAAQATTANFKGKFTKSYF